MRIVDEEVVTRTFTLNEAEALAIRTLLGSLSDAELEHYVHMNASFVGGLTGVEQLPDEVVATLQSIYREFARAQNKAGAVL